MAAPSGMSSASESPETGPIGAGLAGKGRTQRQFAMPGRWRSVGVRLLAAFLGISGLSALAVGTAYYAFIKTDTAIVDLLGKRMPEAMEVLELSRKVENIVVVAPSLLGAVTDDQRAALAGQALGEIDQAATALQTFIANTNPTPTTLAAAAYHDWIRSINVQLDHAVTQRLDLEHRRTLGRMELKRAADGLRSLFEPSFRLIYVLSGVWESSRFEINEGDPEQLRAFLSVGDDLVKLLPQRQAYEQVTDLEHRIAEILVAETPHDTLFRLEEAQRALADSYSVKQLVPPHALAKFSDYLGWIDTLVNGPDNLADLHLDFLRAQGRGRTLVAVNEHIAQLLTASLDKLTLETRQAIDTARADMQKAHTITAAVLLVIVLLSFGSAIGIAVFYVQKRLVRRLTALSGAMLAIAGGSLRTRLPEPGTEDEIGKMAQALRVFRDTALEVERTNLHQLNEARTRLMDAVENVSEGFALYDRRDCLILCNNVYHRLYDNKISDILVPGVIVQTIIDTCLARGLYTESQTGRVLPKLPGETQSLEQRVGHRWVLVNRRRTPEGRMVVVRTDITERKQQELVLEQARDAAEQAAKAKSNFLAAMSHEIRTPMNGVVSMANLLDQSALSGEQRQMVGIIRQSAHALLEIIDDILDFSKIEAGRLSVERLEFDFVALVEDVAELMALRANEKGLELVVDCDPAIPARLLGDPTRVRQVLFNLVGNAIKFTQRGLVAIDAEWQAEHSESGRNDRGALQISVRDTGIGLTEDQSARLFRPFVQAEDSTARKFGGTGLGLAISRRLVELMGGSIGLDSKPGEGSRFWFALPAEAADPQPAQPPGALFGMQVAIAGFSAEARAALHRQIRAAGCIPIDIAPDLPSIARALAGRGGSEARAVLANSAIGGVSLLDGTRALGPAAVARLILACPRQTAGALSESGQKGSFSLLSTPIRRADLWQALAMAGGFEAPNLPQLVEYGTAYTPPLHDEAMAVGALVLIADDNHTNRLVIGKILSRLGFAHKAVANGIEALACIEQGGVGLLLTDFHMPEMDGFALTAALRQQEALAGHAPLPIIALTADALADTGERCLRAGMNDYMTKPVDIPTLARALERWLPTALPLRRAAEEGQSNIAASATLPAIDPEILDLSRLIDGFGSFDSDARAFLLGFMDDTDRRVETVLDALAAEDAVRASRETHALKGAARTIGAGRLGDIAADIEIMVESGDVALARMLGGALRSAASDLRNFADQAPSQPHGRAA